MSRASPFDFVGSDINMPNTNGFARLAQFKQDSTLAQRPVPMVTAEAGNEDPVRAPRQGAAGDIVEPFSKATLEDKVAKILQKRAAEAQRRKGSRRQPAPASRAAARCSLQ